MSYFAKVLNNKVVDVKRATPEFISSFRDTSPGQWVQTSYNTKGGVHYNDNNQPSANQSKALRKNYASVGYSFDQERDAFIPPQPFPSWNLNESSCLWEAPVAVPTDVDQSRWDEETQQWIGA